MRAGSDLRAAPVKWEDVQGEMVSLFELHWKEVGLGSELRMNYPAYRQLARSGALLIVGLRSKERLVGYWTCTFAPFLHNISQRAAHTDLLFIHPDFRSRVAWKLLLSATQKMLVDKGVDLWFVGSKERRSISALLEREGFSLEEQCFLKVL